MIFSASSIASTLILLTLRLTFCDGFGCCFFLDPFTGEQAFFPLRSVVLNATVVDSIVEVSVEHEFETTHPLFDTTRVTTYELPIDEQGAVTAFRAFIGTRVIDGFVKDKVQAREEFNEAISDGQSAFLAESDRNDVFSLSLGNVPQDELLRVQLVYIAPIEAVTSEKLRFVLPSSLAPEVEPWSVASRLPFRNNGATINVKVATPNAISLSSPTHVIDTSSGAEGMLSATLIDQEFQSRRDIVFEIATSVNPVLQVYPEQTERSTAFMVTVVPSINAVSPPNREFIFVVDRSGSMGRDRPVKVGQALREVLAGLDQGVLFNVLGFGTDSIFLFNEGSRLVSDDDAVQAANRYFDELQSDFGGTNVKRALQRIVNTPVNAIYRRNVILITDAVLSHDETQEVLRFVTNNRDIFQLFTLGVGEEVNRVLINGAARNGGGTADYAFEVNGVLNAIEVRDALQRQIKVASSPTLFVSNIEWGSNGMQAPFVTPPLFSEKRFTLFHIGDNPKLPSTVRLEAEFEGVNELLDAAVYEVGSDSFIQTRGSTETATVIHQMAAREMIRDLEEQRSALHLRVGGATDDEIRNEIVRIGVTYQIASTETSFVAIDNEGWTSVSERELSTSSEVPRFASSAAAPIGGSLALLFCFPGDGLVDVKGKGLIPMRNVRIGDYVGIGQGRGYSRVYSFGHKESEALKVNYIEIYAHGLSKPLMISPDHMLFVKKADQKNTATSGSRNNNKNKKAIPSSLIRVGDKIVLDSGDLGLVTSVKTVVGEGAYAPFTDAGVLVVDGVLVSSYVSLLKDEEELTIGGRFKTGWLNMHWLSHVFQSPHRIMCSLDWNKCVNEKYTDDGKLSEFVAWRFKMAVWYLGIDNVVVEICVGLLLVGFVVMCCGIEMLIKMEEGMVGTGIGVLVGLLLVYGWLAKNDDKKVKDDD